MMAAAIVSALHVLALAIGLPAIWFRSRALRDTSGTPGSNPPGGASNAPGGTLDPAALRRVFAADNAWGIAALLWLVTGLLRAFGGLEKGTTFYLHSHLFWTKMTLFALVVALEVWPMVTLIGWRRALRQGRTPDVSSARRLHAIGHAEMAIVLLMVFVAAFMARGFGVVTR